MFKRLSPQRPHLRRRWMFFICIGLIAIKADAANLQSMIEHSLKQQPRLLALEAQREGLRGLRNYRAQAPGYRLSVGSENVIGSGELSGFQATEVQLALGSQFERGEQLSARIAASDASLDVNQQQTLAAAQQLIDDVTSAYLQIVHLQQRIELAGDALALTQQALEGVEARVASAAVPEAEALRARAAVSKAGIERDELSIALRSAKARLARFVGDEIAEQIHYEPPTDTETPLPPFNQLVDEAATSPGIRLYELRSEEQRRAWRLEQSRAQANISWQVALRHDRSVNDTALGFDLEFPLNQRERRRGLGIAASAELERIQQQREEAWRAHRTALFEAWSGHQQSLATRESYRNQLIPALEAALEQTRAAYQQGRFRYLDLVDAQRALLQAREDYLESQHATRKHWATAMTLTGRALDPYRSQLATSASTRETLPRIE